MPAASHLGPHLARLDDWPWDDDDEAPLSGTWKSALRMQVASNLLIPSQWPVCQTSRAVHELGFFAPLQSDAAIREWPEPREFPQTSIGTCSK